MPRPERCPEQQSALFIGEEDHDPALRLYQGADFGDDKISVIQGRCTYLDKYIFRSEVFCCAW